MRIQIKNILFLLLAQLIVLADMSILPLLRASLKRDPLPFVFFVCYILPVLLLGLFLALAAGSEPNRGLRFVSGTALVLLNGLLLVLQVLGCISFSSLALPLLLAAYGLGILILAWKTKRQ